MKLLQRRTMLATATALMLLLAACGGGTDRTKAQVRLLNASSGYAELELRVDDQVRQASVAYGANAGYVEVDPGKAATSISRPGGAAALLSFTPSLTKNRHTTLLAWGVIGALRQVQLDENAAAPDSGRASLRVFNAAPDAGALDVYLTATDDLLAASVPVQAAATAGALGNWLTINGGTWRLRVTAAGSKTDLRLDLPVFALASRQVLTLVLTPGRGGVLVNALGVEQQGAVGRLDNTQARVRVAAGVAGAATVAVHAGATPLLSATPSPVVNGYALLPAGTLAVAAQVDGAALPVVNVTAPAGGDLTLLVHGTRGAPRVDAIADDNTAPADANQARLRLVNGVAGGPAGGIAMSLDLLPVAGGVAAGMASAPVQVTTTSTARLSVTAPGAAAPLFTAVDVPLAAGASYSVFVLGGSDAPSGTVRKDR